MSPAAKRTLAAAAGVVLLAAAREPWHWWALAGWVAGCAGVWAWRLRRHPWGLCWSCKGSGKNRGSDRTQQGDCPRCTGPGAGKRPGKRLRAGARWVHPEFRR